MRTITTKVYKYSELSEEAKEKARDWYRNATADDSFWSEAVLDDAATIGGLLGIDFKDFRGKPAIYFTGFCSQGDGACFEGNWHYSPGCVKAVKDHAPKDTEIRRIALELSRNARKVFYAVSASVRHVGCYYHENSVSIDVEAEKGDVSQIENAIEEALRDFMRWIYKQLKTEWDYQNSDEQVGETLEANEYEFDEDGNRF